MIAKAGLAKVGCQAALSFAFAFLRRAWRSGEDADLCTDLLTDCLMALRQLPVATLFDDTVDISLWLDVIEKASRFLLTVVEGFVLVASREYYLMSVFCCRHY